MLLANRNTCRNLFGLHPPMQIDGNFGITAGVCEMLIQSRRRRDRPASRDSRRLVVSGSVKNLKARGNFTVDIAWKDGKVTSYKIASAEPREVKVRVNGELRTVTSEKLTPLAAIFQRLEVCGPKFSNDWKKAMWRGRHRDENSPAL